MDRGIPEFNKVVAKREKQMARSLHRERLRGITKAIDNSKPIGYIYPINKKNKEAMIEGKISNLS
jgi:hypothetical protein